VAEEIENLAALTSEEIVALKPTGAQRDLIDQVFKTGQDNPALTDETIENYVRIARNALQKLQDRNNPFTDAIDKQLYRLNLLRNIAKARKGCP
jgi:hypothetical protein